MIRDLAIKTPEMTKSGSKERVFARQRSRSTDLELEMFEPSQLHERNAVYHPGVESGRVTARGGVDDVRNAGDDERF